MMTEHGRNFSPKESIMAYVDTTKKAKIAAALKTAIPKGWKYSLAVRHHSTIVLTVYSAPFDLIRAFKPSPYFNPETATSIDVNNYHYRNHLADETVADVFETIFAALNIDNHNRSDVQTDYFDVGHYVDFRIGRWDKPFQVTGPLAEHTVDA
jgi:hypothetical protein